MSNRSTIVKNNYTEAIFSCPPELLNYRGNKKVEGLYQSIINLIPPHVWYGAGFAGSDAIFRYKKPADFSNLNDIDISVYNAWTKHLEGNLNVTFENTHVFDWMKKHQYGQRMQFVYYDPPYKHDSTACKTQIYKHTFSDNEHKEFLKKVTQVNYNCMISHYPCELYDTMLKDWNTFDIKVSVRSRVQIERLYMNYKPPEKLHDYRFLGSNFSDRQRIKRKISRHIETLMKLPSTERNAIIHYLNSI